MNIVEPQVELWKQESTLKGAWHQIARATRVCYQSKPRDGESSEDFVKRIILKPALVDGSLDDLEHCKFDFDKMHGAMLEHGTIYLIVPAYKWTEGGHYIFHQDNHTRFYTTDCGDRNGNVYVSTNFRVLLENEKLYLLYFLTSPTRFHTKRYTFSIITDIGVTREMNRHRRFSIAEQSTRYCDLTKDKFDNSLSFPLPSWINKDSLETSEVDNFLLSVMSSNLRYADSDEINNFNIYNDEKTWNDIDFYIYANIVAQYCYKALRNKGWRPEQARQVLPLGLKTQAVYTAFDDDWRHFIKLRADNVSGKVHPNMKIIADKIKELFNNK